MAVASPSTHTDGCTCNKCSHIDTRTRVQTHTHACTHRRAHAHAHARTQTQAPTQARTCTRALTHSCAPPPAERTLRKCLQRAQRANAGISHGVVGSTVEPPIDAKSRPSPGADVAQVSRVPMQSVGAAQRPPSRWHHPLASRVPRSVARADAAAGAKRPRVGLTSTSTSHSRHLSIVRRVVSSGRATVTCTRRPPPQCCATRSRERSVVAAIPPTHTSR